MAFFSVVDGHGGRDIVEYLEHALTFHVSEELRHEEKNDGENILNSLERAFLMADIHSKALNITSSGATVRRGTTELSNTVVAFVTHFLLILSIIITHRILIVGRSLSSYQRK